MSTEWMEIYGSYSADELDVEIERLKKEATLYTTQQEGSKAYTKALTEVRDRLHAAVRVRNERRNRRSGGRDSWAVPDFSRVQV